MKINTSLDMVSAAVATAILSASAAFGGTDGSAARDCGAACVETRTLRIGNVDYAYRTIGPVGGTPLVMLNRFRGTMDDWDPAFVDRLATARHVILFDNVGVARTNGTASPRLAGWAEGAADFIAGLDIDRADILGFSFGGLVAQELALRHPDLVRRLVIVGSGAGHVEGADVNPEAIAVATRPVNTDDDFLFLFFRDTPTSQAAGRAHLARLREREDAFANLVDAETWMAMLSAAGDVGSPETSLLNRAGEITVPVLVANGVEDVMIPTFQSFALAQALPNARLTLWPDAGHAFMFQYPDAFGDEVIRFLED